MVHARIFIGQTMSGDWFIYKCNELGIREQKTNKTVCTQVWRIIKWTECIPLRCCVYAKHKIYVRVAHKSGTLRVCARTAGQCGRPQQVNGHWRHRHAMTRVAAYALRPTCVMASTCIDRATDWHSSRRIYSLSAGRGQYIHNKKKKW